VRLQVERIEYQSGDTPVRAYMARAAVEEPRPAILVIHEMWGVNEHIQGVARRFATAGYVALAPDLWVRGGAATRSARAESRLHIASVGALAVQL
jgi:carboxymethylenebutenolidase